MRKSRLILAGILIPVLSIFAGENSMCRRDAATGALNIDNGCFSFTLFPGYMFPVWVKNCDGKPLPGCRFLDRITFLKNNTMYFLDQDLYAQTVILADTPERLLIEKRGTYCDHPQHAVPGNIRVTYAYLIEKGKPAVTVTMTLARDDEEPAEVRFFHPAWSGATPWQTVQISGGSAVPVGRGDGRNPEMYGPAAEAVLSNDSLRFVVSGSVQFFCNSSNSNSFLLGGIKNVWNSRDLTMQITFTVGK